MNKTIDIVQILEKHGATFALMAIMLPLLFLYFWKMIQQKSLYERLFDAQNKILEQLVIKFDKMKDDILEIRIRISGDFKLKGKDDE